MRATASADGSIPMNESVISARATTIPGLSITTARSMNAPPIPTADAPRSPFTSESTFVIARHHEIAIVATYPNTSELITRRQGCTWSAFKGTPNSLMAVRVQVYRRQATSCHSRARVVEYNTYSSTLTQRRAQRCPIREMRSRTMAR